MGQLQAKRLGYYMTHPMSFIIKCAAKGIIPMSDKMYIKTIYKQHFGYKLNLDNPQTFNEKLQWLKLYDRNPEYTKMVDKYAVKQYVANKIGVEHIIPTLGVWDTFDEIDFDELPDQFVLKCTHDSGGVVIVKDKYKMNIKDVKRKIENSLKTNYYLLGREWVYKDVPRKILAEKYLVEESVDNLNDYKLMCFNGEVKCIFICSDRSNGKGLKVTFYDNAWNKMLFERHYPKSNDIISKPSRFDDMIKISEILSRDITFVRIDLYEIQGEIYFGEMTFFPGNGMEEFKPESADYELGTWMNLPYVQ